MCPLSNPALVTQVRQVEMDGALLSTVLFGAVVWLVVAVYLLVCVLLLCSLCCAPQAQDGELESSEVMPAEVVMEVL